MTSVSKVNDIYFRKFLTTHLDNKFDAKDIYDMVRTINPANNRYKMKSETNPKNTESYFFETKMAYAFPTEKSASLFKNLFENIYQKGKGQIELTQKEGEKSNQVMLKMKEPIAIPLLSRTGAIEQQEKRAKMVELQEESQFLSDVFVETIDSLTTSGIYNMSSKPQSKTAQKLIGNVKALERHERRINEGNSNKSLSSLYIQVMKENSIPKHTELNNSIIKEVESARNNRVSKRKATDLMNRMFKDYSVNSLNLALNMSNPAIKNLLKEAKVIDQKVANEKMFNKFMNSVGLGKKEPEIKDKPNVRKFKYK